MFESGRCQQELDYASEQVYKKYLIFKIRQDVLEKKIMKKQFDKKFYKNNEAYTLFF